MATGPKRVAEMAESLEVVYVGLLLALPPILDPRMPLAPYYDKMAGGVGSPVRIVRHDGSNVEPTRPAAHWLARMSDLSGEVNKLLLSNGAMIGAVTIGDMLKEYGLGDASNPLLQFARHYRNACAHGDRWNFLHGEPRNAAELRGRALTTGMHGTRATWEFMAPGDHIDFLRDIRDEMLAQV